MNTQIKRQITTLCLAAPTLESCGFVILRHDGLHLMPCANISPTPTDDYEIAITDQIAASNQGHILYVWHSHPRAAGFSEDDIDKANEALMPQRLFSIPDGAWHEYVPPTYRQPLTGRAWAWGEQDCLSLIRDYYRQTLNLTIGDYDRDEDTPNLGATVAANFAREGFVKMPTKEYRLHDILVFNTNGSPQHMTIFVGNTKLLHHPRMALSRIDQYNPHWRARLAFVARHSTLV